MAEAAALTAVESLGGSLQHLQRQGSDDVRLPGDGLGSLHGLRPQRGDHLGPIDQCQTLLEEDRASMDLAFVF